MYIMQILAYTVHEKILVVKNYTGRSYWRGNFGKKATISAYAKYIFIVSVNIGEENFGE